MRPMLDQWFFCYAGGRWQGGAAVAAAVVAAVASAADSMSFQRVVISAVCNQKQTMRLFRVHARYSFTFIGIHPGCPSWAFYGDVPRRRCGQ